MKRIILGIYLIVGVLAFGNVNSNINDEKVDFTSKLLGTTDGKIISITNGDEIHPLASVTKMMTLLLTYDAIENGDIKIDDMVDIPEEFRHIGGSRIWMAKNDKISVLDLIKATAVYSANNAAYSLANYVGHGDMDAFVRRMNEKAKLLGMTNTSYFTPAGLPPFMTEKSMDVSTVNDIYKLSMELLKNKEYMKIASLKEASIRNGQQTFKNRNKLLGIDGIYGMKTGHHSIAGYNISIVSKKNNMKMLEIVFGSPNEKTRDQVVLKDLDNFYANYKRLELMKKGEKIGEVSVKNAVDPIVNFYAIGEHKKLIKKGTKVEKKLEIDTKLVAPLKAGTKIGEYIILLDDKVYFKKDLILERDVKKLSLFKRLFKKKDNKKS